MAKYGIFDKIQVPISITVIFAVSGFAMIFFGWSLHTEQQKLLSKGIETEGQIVGFQRLKVEHENNLDLNFVPIVMFKTASGEDVTFMGEVAQRFWTNYQMGRTVTVIYDMEHPWDAKINEFARLGFMPVILFLSGFGTVLISLYIILRRGILSYRKVA